MVFSKLLDQRWTLNEVNKILKAFQASKSQKKARKDKGVVLSELDFEHVSKNVMKNKRSPDSIRLLIKASPHLLEKSRLTNEQFERELFIWRIKAEGIAQLGSMSPSPGKSENEKKHSSRSSRQSRLRTSRRVQNKKQGNFSETESSIESSTSWEQTSRRKRKRAYPSEDGGVGKQAKSTHMTSGRSRMATRRKRTASINLQGIHTELDALKQTKWGRAAIDAIYALQGRFALHCVYEWFYSDIDEDFFLRDEFKECLQKLASEGISLSKNQRLTRCEWGLIREKIGRIRRTSSKFFERERLRLEAFRKEVRGIQAQYLANLNEYRNDFPYQVYAPLQVGMRVTALHFSGQLATGSVLATSRNENSYLIQFDIADLGVHFCPDYNIKASIPNEILISRTHSLSLETFGEHYDLHQSFEKGNANLSWTDIGKEFYGGGMDNEESNPSLDKSNLGDPVNSPFSSKKDINAPFGSRKLVDRQNAMVDKRNDLHENSGAFPERRAFNSPLNANEESQTQIHAYPSSIAEMLKQKNEELELIAKQHQNVFSKSQQLAASKEMRTDFAKRWMKLASVLVQQLHETRMKSSVSYPRLSENALDLLVAGISLLLAIRHCSEKQMTLLEINSNIDAVLQFLRPNAEENQDIFEKIKSSIALIKAGCVSR